MNGTSLRAMLAGILLTVVLLSMVYFSPVVPASWVRPIIVLELMCALGGFLFGAGFALWKVGE